jgi:hypothetical protein
MAMAARMIAKQDLQHVDKRDCSKSYPPSICCQRAKICTPDSGSCQHGSWVRPYWFTGRKERREKYRKVAFVASQIWIPVSSARVWIAYTAILEILCSVPHWAFANDSGFLSFFKEASRQFVCRGRHLQGNQD